MGDSKIHQREIIGGNKYCLFPIKYPEIWNAYEKSVAMFWNVGDIDFSKDSYDWNYKLNDDERFFIKHVLAFFSQSDAIVNENLVLRFYHDLEYPEVRAFYTIQMAIETIHSHVYSLLIDTYIKDRKEQDILFNAIENVDIVKKKAHWVFKWIDGNQEFVERLIAFAIVEGIFFAGSFCSIFWLRKRGLLPGLSTANDLISRDETLHWEFAALIYRQFNLKISKERFFEILLEAVTIEKEFIAKSLSVDLIGMNVDLMCQYIEYVADYVSIAFGMEPFFKSENPFNFMVLMGISSKTNFFEKRNTEYQLIKDQNIKIVDDF